jgi:hypothetical protein
MADTQALQGCLILMACNESHPQARLAARHREAAGQDSATALARELVPVLSGDALERRCTILPTASLVVRAACLLDPGRVPAFQDTCAEIRRAHPDRHVLIT